MQVHGVSAVSGRAVMVDAVSQVVTVDTMSQAERQAYNIQVGGLVLVVLTSCLPRSSGSSSSPA